ncbi:uncharacterized protein LOC108475273 [Gossypium arboreum]|uniref:uncharacterized protein LOC108475273 n=1 Tax=Gossypium arboreum TaxID=29729 RepID=UPI00081968DA|nr:uncharacterized protein LOC108475273 [Gossypium arboreum]
MSTRGTRGRGTTGHGRGHRSARAESSSIGNLPNLDTKATERIMNDLDCTPKQKLKGAVSLLRDEAYQWWLTVNEGIQPERLYVDARWQKFMNLTQGDVSVAEYEAKFLRLNRYVRGMVVVEHERCRERDFTALVDKAKIAEEVKCIECQNRESGRSKRESEPSSFIQRPKKKARVDGHHQGECWKKTRACLKCGPLEHSIKECPRRFDQMQASGMGTAPPSRVVQQPPRGRGQARDGNGLRCACTVSENLGILVESTASVVTVLSLLGQSVRAIFLDDLMELPFGEFDLILEMDWLVKHRVSLNCATERVVLRTEEDSEVVLIGERRNYLSNVIFALRAEKLVRKGCEAYLAYIIVSNSEDSYVKDIRTVKDLWSRVRD